MIGVMGLLPAADLRFRSLFRSRSSFYNRTVSWSRQDVPMETEVTAAELEPPWWRRPRATGRRRAPLSRDAIVDAALAILDADGFDALTIRRLGHELDTGSASLYWHVAGKDELCELVYDRIMGEIELPEPDPSRWEEQLKDLARQAYRTMLSHNDAVRLSIGRPPAGPNSVRIVEWMLGLMRGAGIPDQPAAYFGNVLGRFLDASVLEASMSMRAGDAGGGPDRVREHWARLPAERFPNLTVLAETTFAADADSLFEFGLELVVRGLAAYKRAPGG
jgi:AcrR family transcriptional regulator